MSGPLRVLIVQKDMPHYRVRFFELLKSRLTLNNVELSVVYGQPVGVSAELADRRELDFGEMVPSRTFRIGGKTAYWQPLLGRALRSDLVIVEQANRLLVNYPLLVAGALGLTRVALWGHGRDFQARNRRSWGERAKAVTSRWAWWWFAYTATSADIVAGLGFPRERTTVVQNASDTSALRRAVDVARREAADDIRTELALVGRNVGIFVGGMYRDKRLEFLVAAAREIRGRVADFELLLVGAGPDKHLAEAAAEELSWVHFIGPAFGADLARCMAVSRVALMPGLVGLGVLDSFASGVPMVTTRVAYHSPEIEYLVDGVNGVVVGDSSSVEAFAAAVVRVLSDEAYREGLVAGCFEATSRYTVEAMADRFADGVVAALADRR